MDNRIFHPMRIEPAQFFQLLSDDTRLRCLLLMQQEGELCVCELTHALDIIQPKVSRHLAMLRDSGVVKDRRQGQWIYYQLNPDLPSWATEVMQVASSGFSADKPFRDDKASLCDMPNRPGARCCA
jgi:ArsR family transcriptional regulator